MTSRTIIIQREIPHYRVPLFKALYARYGIRVVAAETPPPNTGLQTRAHELGEAFVPAPFVFPDPNDPFRAKYPIDWILERLAPETIISEFSMRNSSAWGLPLARRRGRFRRLIFWTHGWTMARGFRTPKEWAAQFSRLAPFAAADAMATYTHEGARWVRRMLPWMPVTALGNTIDQTEIRAAAERAHPVRHGSPQFLAIGRLRADKAFDQVIEVFQKIQRHLPDAALTIIGDGPERERLQRMAGDDLDRSIRILGAVYGEDNLAPHFLGADTYLLVGAAGLSVNHALGYHLPIVAFPRGPRGPFHHPEIEYVVDGETGLMVRPYDLDAMATAVVASVGDGTFSKLRTSMASKPPVPTIDDVAANFGKLPGVTPL